METFKVSGYGVELWKSPAEIEQMAYTEYWNDEDIEKGKEWWILDGDFGKMETYLEKSYLDLQFQQVITFLKHNLGKSLEGCGADLAAGNCWAIPRLLAAGSVERVYAVEYSQHRLLKLGPSVLRHYKVPRDKVILCLGGFYELQIPNKSLDFVFLSQAFHHADNPHRLLLEIRRVLKADGSVLMIGEHIPHEVPVTFRRYIRHFVKYAVARIVPRRTQERIFGRRFVAETLLPGHSSLPPDPVLGDHYYRAHEYHDMFSRGGFKYYNLRISGSGFQSFILTRPSLSHRGPRR